MTSDLNVCTNHPKSIPLRDGIKIQLHALGSREFDELIPACLIRIEVVGVVDPRAVPGVRKAIVILGDELHRILVETVIWCEERVDLETQFFEFAFRVA